MKKFIRILACAVILSVALLSFTGCGNDDGGNGQTVKNGDIVIIDYAGTLGGVPFAGGSDKNFTLGIGSGMFIPGFEEQIIGMKEGEIKDIDVTFPVNYHADLAGQTAVFNITLHSIKNLSDKSGSFVIELYPEYAPLTVENFMNLVQSGFYDGLTFHRIVDGFMAQGGGFAADGSYKEADTIVCETIDNGWTQNTLKHTAGVLSMAHAGTNTGSSQFFIMFGDAPGLDGLHAGFGKVTEGFETIEALQKVDRKWGNDGAVSSPIHPVIIKSMRVINSAENGNPRVEAELNWKAE